MDPVCHLKFKTQHSKLGAKATIIRTYLIPFLIHLVIGVVIIAFYYSQNAIRWEAIAVHAAVLSAFLFIFFSFQNILLLLSMNRKAVVRFSGVLFLLFSAWYLVQHLTSFIAFLFWTEGVSFLDLLSYLPHLPLLLSQLGISVLVASMAAFLFLIAAVFCYIIWYKLILKYADDANAPSKKSLLFSIPILLLSAGVLGIFIHQIQSGKLLSLRGEPFADFFRTTQVYDLRYKPVDFNITDHIEERRRFAQQLSDYSGDQPDVIFIMLDAARADRMSVYGYERKTTPALDSLYATGRMAKAEFATTPCPHSECGITAMLSSLFYLQVHPVNYKVHEVFSDLGYDTNFFLSGDHSRVYGFMKDYYGNDITLFKDGFNAPDRHPTDDALLLDFIDDLPSKNESGNPAFFYFHMMSTHTMGARYDHFNLFSPNDYQKQIPLMGKGRFTPLDEEEIQLISNNYDNGMLQADAFIADILQHLSAQGYLENAIVVITSDHGEGLGENNIFGHAQHLQKTTLQVPLLFYFTQDDLKPESEIPFGSLKDIGPTILGRMGIDAPQTWEGIDLLSSRRSYSHHMSPFKPGSNAVIVQDNEGFFMMIDSSDDDLEVYNLTEDPYQVQNIAEEIESDLLARLKSTLRKD